MNKIVSVALDGPAGAGKSTVAKKIAVALDAVYLDTGAMYRTVGLYMDRNGIDGVDKIAAAAGEPEVEVVFMADGQHMLLNGEDVTPIIRSPEASMLASKVGSIPEVRERMVAKQQAFAKGHSVVMDGRDIGTVVLPDATLKVFLTATPEVRAQRRYLELVSKGTDQSYEDVLEDIKLRDFNDANRAASPMRQADDALLLDTSEMTESEVVAFIVDKVREAVGG